MPTYVHANRNNHELCVEAHERLILGETDLLNKSDLHNAQEVPVQTSVDDENEYFGNLVPNGIDVDEDLADRGRGVGGYPDAEDRNVDCSDDNNGSPLDVADSLAVLGDEGNSIDDNLHEQLNLEG